jgi:hypothetical protein
MTRRGSGDGEWGKGGVKMGFLDRGGGLGYSDSIIKMGKAIGAWLWNSSI